MTKTTLDEFGNRLIREVRDKTISDWDRILCGQMKGERAERIRETIESLPHQASGVISSLVPDVVDSVLHHLLNWLEQEEVYCVSAEIDGETDKNISLSSDGFAGELYGQRGWIQRFSDYRKL